MSRKSVWLFKMSISISRQFFEISRQSVRSSRLSVWCLDCPYYCLDNLRGFLTIWLSSLFVLLFNPVFLVVQISCPNIQIFWLYKLPVLYRFCFVKIVWLFRLHTCKFSILPCRNSRPFRLPDCLDFLPYHLESSYSHLKLNYVSMSKQFIHMSRLWVWICRQSVCLDCLSGCLDSQSCNLNYISWCLGNLTDFLDFFIRTPIHFLSAKVYRW